MIRVKKVSKARIKDYINIAFKDDKELGNYHILGNVSLDKMVSDTVYRILDTTLGFDSKFYEIIKDKTPIGFFVIVGRFLYSFGVNNKFRSKENLVEWFEIVKKELHYSFYSVMNEKNTRAIEFLQKQGMEIKNEDKENKIVTLIYTRCQQVD